MIDFIEACWKADKFRRILWLPVLFGMGIGLYFSFSEEPNKWITLGIIELLILMAIIFRYHINILYILGYVFVFVLGFAIVQLKGIYLNNHDGNIYNQTMYLKGVISKIDTNYSGKQRFTFEQLEDFDGKIYDGQYRVVMRNNKKKAAVGQCVEFVGTIMPSPVETVVDGYQLDRKNYFDGLKGNGYVESNFFITDCKSDNISYFNKTITLWRQKIVNHISSVLPESQAAIAAAIIAGDKNLISPALYEQYRNSGLAHFLAISGLHMSMISGLMFALVRLLLAFIPKISLNFDTRKIAAVCSWICAMIYLFISGMAVPAQRAFIMISIVLLGVLTNRRAISMYSVAWAAFLILLISPQIILSASFQMSFAAVIGLIAFYEKYAQDIKNNLSKGSSFYNKTKVYIVGILVTDFVASISTLPFAIYHFNMVALYTTLGNLLAGPIIGLLIMPCVLFTLLFMPLGLGDWFLKLGGYGIAWVNDITKIISDLPNSGLYIPSMPTAGLLCIVFGGLWLVIWQAPWRKIGIIAIIIGFISITFVKIPDILVGDNFKAIAFKNEEGKLELVSSRGGNFIKRTWKNKYPFSDKKTMLNKHPELWIDKDIVTIGTHQYNIKKIIGFSAYKTGNGFDIKTIRDDIGYRYWNLR